MLFCSFACAIILCTLTGCVVMSSRDDLNLEPVSELEDLLERQNNIGDDERDNEKTLAGLTKDWYHEQLLKRKLYRTRKIKMLKKLGKNKQTASEDAPNNLAKLIKRKPGHGNVQNPGKGGQGQGLGRGKGYMFDKPQLLGPDSEYERLLEGMSVDIQGKIRLPIGVKKFEKAKLVGENMDSHKVEPSPYKRNFDTYLPKYWPNGTVPYTIDPAFSQSDVNVILTAMDQFHQLTCIQWVPYSTGLGLGHQNYVNFISGSGCWSYLGLINAGKQDLSLSISGCVNVATAVHEMLHTLGAWHEMQRTDRDEYATILSQNMNPSGAGNFNKKSTYVDHPYDQSSDLQYSLHAFSLNGDKTIQFHDWRLEFLADIATGLMFYDVADVTSAYGCADSCPVINCANGGFVKSDCQCYCPDVLTGALCEQPVSNSPTCGGVINVPAGQEIELTSPNYPNNYDVGLKCTWVIKGTPGNILRGTVVDMAISNNGNACYHWLEYRYNLLGQTGPKRCGTSDHEVWDTTIDEEMNTMIVIFDSYVGSDKAPSRGFKINFKSIGTGCADYPCKFGSCSSEVNTSGYTCTCDQGFSGTNCDILSEYAIVGCTVEVGETCVLKQNETGDTFDWETRWGPAPYSAYTGPGLAQEGFNYLYTKTWSKRVQGNRAVMYTDIDFPPTERCLEFWYHMYAYPGYSSWMGTLNVYVEDSSGNSNIVFTKSGSQGNQWIKAIIDLPSVDGLKVTFEGITGAGWMSDMAVDNIWFIPGTCGSG